MRRRTRALDDLDKELEKRGHRFVRYADDCNIYVRSERAGMRVMGSVKAFLTRKLKLKVNEEKSAVSKTGERKFLGFRFTAGRQLKRAIAAQALVRFRRRVARLTRRTTVGPSPVSGPGCYGEVAPSL